MAKKAKKTKREVAYVTTDDGRVIKRTEYIRELWNDGQGMTISQIAKKLEIPYQYVWQAVNRLRKKQMDVPEPEPAAEQPSFDEEIAEEEELV